MFTTLAARAAARPWRALGLALVFLVVAGVLGGPVAGRLSSSDAFLPGDAEASRAAAQIEAATGRAADAGGVTLLVRGADPAAGARAAAARLGQVPGIADARALPELSRDGRSALVVGTLAAGADDEEVAAAAEDAYAGDRSVVVGGDAVAGEQIGSTVEEDLSRAELLAFPLLALLSLLLFRGRAALLPLLVGITTVLGTFLVLSAVDLGYDLNVFCLNLVIGLGLGLAIDYTLFLVTRFREELAAGAEVDAAVRTTMQTAGRTVAFSAATVAAALATLLVFPQGFAKSMGAAGVAVAVVAAFAALLVTPALLGLWGHKLLSRRAAATSEGRWGAIARWVMRRPGRVAAVTAALMVLAAVPAAGVQWAPVDANVIPKDKSARVVADALQRDFGGRGQAAVTAVLRAPADARGTVDAQAAAIARTPGVRSVAVRDLGRGTWRIDATVPGDPAGQRARDVVGDVRALSAPVPTQVTGPAAEFLDQQSAISSRLVLAGVLLAGLTFVVLWLMTGSVVLPLKAIVMNVLTVGAALAPLVLIYQEGRLEGLLGYTSSGGVETTDFLVTAALIFALSTDYGVFLLGRIKEVRDAGAPTREAVAAGLGRTGRVVTAAAILLAVAIGAFSTSSISFIQQIGIATATGVLLDAFVVRTFLVPSLMALMDEWNWWSPKPLRRLHERVGISEVAPAR